MRRACLALPTMLAGLRFGGSSHHHDDHHDDHHHAPVAARPLPSAPTCSPSMSVAGTPLDMKSGTDKLIPGLSNADEKIALDAAIAATKASARQKPLPSMRVLRDYKHARAAREKERRKRAAAAAIPKTAPFTYTRNDAQREAKKTAQQFVRSPHEPATSEGMTQYEFRQPWMLRVPVQ
jgi:hypothetical protein